MKTKNVRGKERKFIHFHNRKIEFTREFIIDVYNHKEEHLGIIQYWNEPRFHKQFIFEPEFTEPLFFTSGCLEEIIIKLKALNKGDLS